MGNILAALGARTVETPTVAFRVGWEGIVRITDTSCPADCDLDFNLLWIHEPRLHGATEETVEEGGTRRVVMHLEEGASREAYA